MAIGQICCCSINHRVGFELLAGFEFLADKASGLESSDVKFEASLESYDLNNTTASESKCILIQIK